MSEWESESVSESGSMSRLASGSGFETEFELMSESGLVSGFELRSVFELG
jgi:hypothetical protein